MEKELLGCCPRCQDKLIATHLFCNNCELELNADFKLTKFDYLAKDELDFIDCFLNAQGNFKALQAKKHISYPAAKKRLADILVKLGHAANKVYDLEKPRLECPDHVPILESDAQITQLLKQKLNQAGGRTTIKLLQGEACEIWYAANGNGLETAKIPIPNQLTWDTFAAAVEIVIEKGGRAEKGNARAGKLGSERLPFDSVEGYIAHKVHGVQAGESAFGPGFVVCAVLAWAEICKNERGYLSIAPRILQELGGGYEVCARK